MTLGSDHITTIGELAQVVRDAHAARTRLRIVAGRSWIDAGRPVDADATLDLSLLTGIVDYAVADFTLTARAGTTLAEIDAAAMAHGQYLPLDPHGARTGTLGATLATASAGPLATSGGTPRDVTLGVTFVDGAGAVIQGGGRVVKNVAGFDLVRMSIGAWGTLGVIAEATVRLRALPPTDITLAVAMPSDVRALAARLHAVADADIQPLASELLNASMARRTGAGDSCTLLIRIAGNSSSVRAQRDALHRIAPMQEVPAAVWRRIAEAEPAGGGVVRLASHPADVARLWVEILARVGADDVLALASVRRGVVRVCAPVEREGLLHQLAHQPPPNSTTIVERLSATSWPVPSVHLTSRLAVRVRQAFDPQHILNPGILAPEPT